MKFGREFRIHLEKTLPEWRDKYLRYKLLKKLINNIIGGGGGGVDVPAPRLPFPELQIVFERILREEIQKFNDFYVRKEAFLALRFQALKEKIEQLKERERYYRLFTSGIGFIEDTTALCKDLVAIHGEMILLKSYSSLNFAGLIKILKKFDKHTGAMLSLPFTHYAFHQPFFSTESLTRLVHECEAHREILFPMNAEVVEPTAVGDDEVTDTVHANQSNAELETTLSLVEETVHIYRSTIATLTTIEGIKKASSTTNPFSMPYIFGRQDYESTGDVTAENSPCNSFVSMHSLDDENGDVSSP